MRNSTKIIIATSENDLKRCFPVMVQLRTTLKENEFIKRVKKQWHDGYKLAFIENDRKVIAVAGFRISECLSWGKFLYIDDFITDEKNRSKGYGNKLFNFLSDYARKNDCGELHLDSGVQRFDAHRFYLKKRMDITCHHFALKVSTSG